MDMFPWDLRSGADMDVKASIRMEGRTRIASACQHYNRNKKYIAGISVSENIRKTNIRNTSHSDGFSKLFPARMTGGKFRFSLYSLKILKVETSIQSQKYCMCQVFTKASVS